MASASTTAALDQGYGDSGWPQDHAKYRTLCVRTCDGFYFPIGDNVGRERLHQDARTCSARCDGEAKLFYYPTNGGSVDTMVDMGGRPYAQMPNAFLYRKTLVQGCTCKPAPWSAESAARHQGYKDEAAALAEMRGAVSGAMPARPSVPPTAGKATAAARSKPTCSARTTARSKPPGTAASAGTLARDRPHRSAIPRSPGSGRCIAVPNGCSPADRVSDAG